MLLWTELTHTHTDGRTHACLHIPAPRHCSKCTLIFFIKSNLVQCSDKPPDGIVTHTHCDQIGLGVHTERWRRASFSAVNMPTHDVDHSPPYRTEDTGWKPQPTASQPPIRVRVVMLNSVHWYADINPYFALIYFCVSQMSVHSHSQTLIMLHVRG